uniref:Uncharacterized protein n=1 Tax=Vespula pensylvanica TaxID=30213 RepID=A0A834U4B6_VESPE|nr:hypothetical protein H0235_012285 [Vespula pensylvanica]
MNGLARLIIKTSFNGDSVITRRSDLEFSWATEDGHEKLEVVQREMSEGRGDLLAPLTVYHFLRWPRSVICRSRSSSVKEVLPPLAPGRNQCRDRRSLGGKTKRKKKEVSSYSLISQTDGSL